MRMFHCSPPSRLPLTHRRTRGFNTGETTMNSSTLSSILARRPGFLVRRLHQIFTSIYTQNCREFETTPVQSSVMQVLFKKPGMDQVSLATEIGMDRDTTSGVLGRLEKRGVVKRKIDQSDRRNKYASLTPQGKAMITKMRRHIQIAHDKLLEPLSAKEKALFMKMLCKLVDANNDLDRVIPGRF
jgi:DNA-binding MarR family transcriptional regulator